MTTRSTSNRSYGFKGSALGLLRRAVAEAVSHRIPDQLLSSLQAAAARAEYATIGLHSGHPMDFYGQQSPRHCTATPDVSRVGLAIKGQGNAVKRLWSTSYSHLPPRLLPAASLARSQLALKAWNLNAYMSGVTK